ncbi:MAG: heterodisulfide reductase-related iron-sulfur binding cluster [Solimonas sp.]
MKCGLCLPHCPTYQETRHEADSPRGRIALMQGFATGGIGWSARLQAHLDGCLGCRSCERVCPAKVPYGELIDAGRTLLAQCHHGGSSVTRWLGPWLTSARLRALARGLLAFYQRSGLQRLARLAGLHDAPRIGRWLSLVPVAGQAIELRGRCASQTRRVQLFRGCVGDIADTATLTAVRQLLERCGFAVDEPAAQTCCGALHQHAGEPRIARRLLDANIAAFAGDDSVLYAASGCGATLKEYGRLAGNDAARAFSARVRDPHRFLLDHWPRGLALRPLPAKVALHLPCTQRNVTGDGDAIGALLKKIPGISVEPLDLQHNCCGAAGTYFLSQPRMADRLLAHKLDALAAMKPDHLVSSNVGCTLHIAAGLRRRGLNVPVLHPLALLARQWPSDT